MKAKVWFIDLPNADIDEVFEAPTLRDIEQQVIAKFPGARIIKLKEIVDEGRDE